MRTTAIDLRLTWRERSERAIALWLRRWGQRRHRESAGRVVRVATELVRRKKYCLLATRADDGVHARVLQPVGLDADLTVWLGTSPASHKVQELRRDSRATLVYEDDRDQSAATLMGTILLVDDPVELQRRFPTAFYAFFPEGPLVDYVLLRFVPSRIEVWNARRRLTPEPFGLRASTIERDETGAWRLA